MRSGRPNAFSKALEGVGNFFGANSNRRGSGELGSRASAVAEQKAQRDHERVNKWTKVRWFLLSFKMAGWP